MSAARGDTQRRQGQQWSCASLWCGPRPGTSQRHPWPERRAILTEQLQACGIGQRSCAPALHSSMPSAASPYGLPTSSLPDLVILKWSAHRQTSRSELQPASSPTWLGFSVDHVTGPARGSRTVAQVPPMVRDMLYVVRGKRGTISENRENLEVREEDRWPFFLTYLEFREFNTCKRCAHTRRRGRTRD